MALTGFSERWLRECRTAGRLRFEKQKQPGKKGSAQRFDFLEDLAVLCGRDLPSLEIQLHALRHPAPVVAPPTPPGSVEAAPPAPPPTADHDPAAPISPAPVIEPSAGAVEVASPLLTEWQIAIANTRLAIVHEVLDRSAAEPKRRTAIIREVAVAHHLATSTISNYLKAHRAGGYRGLCPRWGRGRAVDPLVVAHIKDRYLAGTPRSMALVADEAEVFCVAAGRPAPSYSTVRQICAEIPKGVAVFHREGRRAWEKSYEPILRRDLNELPPAAIYCGDHRELDIFIQMPGEAKPQRPWLTAWEDMGTRKIVGWHLDLAPSSRTIALAFRHAVLTEGIPSAVYIDNGKDYVCHYLNGKEHRLGQITFDAEALGVFGLLNVAVQHAEPYAARSKPIERWFRTLSERFDREQPGWCGRDTTRRPEKLKKDLASGALWTLDALRVRLAAFIAWYNAREHSELRCSPDSLWADVARKIPGARALDLLLMKGRTAKVFNDGIHFLNMRYWASELSGWIGQTIETRYDPADVSRLLIFAERRLLCEATTAIPGSMKKVGEEQIKQKKREQKIALNIMRQYPAAVQIAHYPDVALAKAVAARPARSEPQPDMPAAAMGGEVIPFVTRFDRQARAVAALPAPVEAPAIAVNDGLRAQVDAAVEAYREEQAREQEAARVARQQEEERAEAYRDEQWRLEGLDLKYGQRRGA